MKKHLILLITFYLFVSFASAQGTIKVACVGDGITEGYGSSDVSKTSYVAQLKKLLGKKYTVENFGSYEATACRNTYKPYASLEIFLASQEFNPNIVFIALGTNDSKPEVWKTDDYAKNFEADLTYICKQFEALPTKPDIYICLPAPVLPSTTFEQQPLILSREIIPLVRKVAKDNNYTIVDFNSPLKNCTDCYSADDKLHPNDKGHRIMAERTYFAIVKKSMEQKNSQ